MDKKAIENIFQKEFFFLKELGYTNISLFDSSSNYDLGIVLNNDEIKQEISFAFYDRNPLNIESSLEFGIFLKVNRGNEHIDFSRLLKENSKLTEYCHYQYFVVPKNIEVSYFLRELSNEILVKYKKLISGKEWISNNYDLRDDY